MGIFAIGKLRALGRFNPSPAPWKHRVHTPGAFRKTGIRELVDAGSRRAIGHFEELLGKRAKDGSSMMRIERCRQFMKVPPGNNWQGIAIAEAT